MNEDFAQSQDAVADSLATIITLKNDGDTLVSAQALRQALGTMGIPVGIRGLEAEARGDRDAATLFIGMARVIALMIDTLDLAIAREEVDSL
jgi:hypothetical protein